MEGRGGPIDAQSGRPSHAPKRVLVVLGVLSAFGPLSIDLYLPALPSIGDDLGVGASSVQLSITACLIGLALGQLIAGPTSDRHGRRGVLLVGVVAFAVCSLLCAIAPTVEVLVLFRLVQGLAGAFGIVIARAMVRDLFPGSSVNRIFSRLTLVSGLAPVVAPVVGGQLLHVMDWRGLFLVLAGIGVCIVVASYVVLPETLAPQDRHGHHNAVGRAPVLATLLRDRRFMGYAFAGGFAGGVLFAYISASSFVVEDIHRGSAQLFSAIFALISVGIVACGQLNARLATQAREGSLLAAGLGACWLGSAACLACVVLDLPLGSLAVAWLVAIAPMGIIQPATMALGLASYGHAAGTAAAVLGTLQFLLGALISPLVGVAGEDSAIPMAVVMVSLSSAAIACFLTTRAPVRPRTPVAHSD